MSPNLQGALLMMASMAAFTCNDALLKLTGGTIPLFQLLFLRGVLASALIFAVAWHLGKLAWALPRRDWGLIALRSIAEIGAAYFFITALLNMPLANATAILQILPLTVTMGAALYFKEPVEWRRWLAIAIGFGGMLLIVRPGAEGFTVWSLYVLAAVCCVTIRDLSTRRMSAVVPSMTVTLIASVAVTVVSGIASLGQGWIVVSMNQGVLIAAAAIFIVGGYLFSVLVMRVGEISYVAPFRYTGLVWALVLGWALFGEWPEWPTMLGAGIVVATGLFNLYRETESRRRKRKNASDRV